MKIEDFLYGEHEFEKWIVPLLHTPAVQRLRWVALSNVPSLSYPVISGVSRYAHSLGVCILAQKVSSLLNLQPKDARNLQCSALLHDAGMPPLGHLTEEALADIGIDFDHELSLRIILMGEGRRFEAMPDGKKIGVTEAFQSAGVEARKVFDNIKGEGCNGELLAAKIDLDNIDNIIRLHKLIFGLKSGYDPIEIALTYFGKVSSETQRAAFEQWKKTRIELYTKLMFSIPDLALKATIKRLIKLYFLKELESKSEEAVIDAVRFMNDHQFSEKILRCSQGVSGSVAFYSGEMDKVVCYGWVNSVEKSALQLIKKAVPERNSSYYIDFIPDKRYKYTDGYAQPTNGALVALFATGVSGKQEKSMIKFLLDMLPDWQIGFLPNANHEDSYQIGLV